MKYTYLIVATTIILSLFSMSAMAVECGSTPTEDCTVTASTTFPGGQTYSLIDANSNGAIIIGGNNIILDCNNSKILGNQTSNSRGILNGYNNVSIINCKVENFTYSISLSGGVTNILIDNLTSKVILLVS